MKTMGQVAFEAYQVSKGGLTFDGRAIPAWDALTGETGAAVKLGWEEAAKAVVYENRVRTHLHARLVDAECAAKELPPSREASLVITKIHEAQDWEHRRQLVTDFAAGRG